jgi:hypothetical protein
LSGAVRARAKEIVRCGASRGVAIDDSAAMASRSGAAANLFHRETKNKMMMMM